jgi:hypothetical protein
VANPPVSFTSSSVPPSFTSAGARVMTELAVLGTVAARIMRKGPTRVGRPRLLRGSIGHVTFCDLRYVPDDAGVVEVVPGLDVADGVCGTWQVVLLDLSMHSSSRRARGPNLRRSCLWADQLGKPHSSRPWRNSDRKERDGGGGKGEPEKANAAL